MHGKISKDSLVRGAASSVWEIYRGFALARFVNQHLSDVVGNVEFIEGDGGVGSVIRLTFVPPAPPSEKPGVGYMIEKFTIADDEKRIKEAEQVEGGYLTLGFNSYRVRFEIIENDSQSSIVKTTIKYDIENKLSENTSLVTFNLLDIIAEAIDKYLFANKASA